MVRRLRLPVSLIGLAVLFAGCDALKPPPFERFTSQADGFTVMMPGKPTKQTQRVATAMGQLNFDFYVSSGFGYEYAVASLKMPFTHEMSNGEIQQRLDGARDGAIKNVNGKLNKESHIRWADKYPGREIEVSVPARNTLIRQRFYFVGSHMYQAMVVGSKETVYSDNAEKFFESFTLTETKE